MRRSRSLYRREPVTASSSFSPDFSARTSLQRCSGPVTSCGRSAYSQLESSVACMEQADPDNSMACKQNGATRKVDRRFRY